MGSICTGGKPCLLREAGNPQLFANGPPPGPLTAPACHRVLRRPAGARGAVPS